MTNNKKYYPWIVVALLWGVALLNYMDRQMLSTMKSAMMIDITELESATNFGRLMAVFLWIYGLMSPVAGMIADRINRKWLIRGQSLRLVVRYTDDGIFDRFQPDLYSPRYYGSQRSFVHPCRTFADHGLSPRKNEIISRRDPHDRALHRTGIGWFRGHHRGGIQLGNDFPLVRNYRDCIQSRPDFFPEREKRSYGHQTGFGTRTERESGESGDKGNGNVVRQHFILDYPTLLRHFELAGWRLRTGCRLCFPRICPSICRKPGHCPPLRSQSLPLSG